MKTRVDVLLNLEDDYQPMADMVTLSTGGRFIRCGHENVFSSEAAMWFTPRAARRLVNALTQALDKLPLLEPEDPAEFDHPPGL